MTDTKGLYEARIQLATNIWRVFCFFDNDKLVILMNGFQKKTEKTPKSEIDKAKKIMAEYFNEKRKMNTKVETNKGRCLWKSWN